MCLSVPKQVLSQKGGVAIVKIGSDRQKIGALIEVRKGDWVLTQNNIIISKISAKQAKEINELLHAKSAKSFTRKACSGHYANAPMRIKA